MQFSEQNVEEDPILIKSYIFFGNGTFVYVFYRNIMTKTIKLTYVQVKHNLASDRKYNKIWCK